MQEGRLEYVTGGLNESTSAGFVRTGCPGPGLGISQRAPPALHGSSPRPPARPPARHIIGRLTSEERINNLKMMAPMSRARARPTPIP